MWYFIIWAVWSFMAFVEGQAEFGKLPQLDLECVLLITSQVFLCEDDLSKSYLRTDKLEVVRLNETHTYVTGELETLKTIDANTRIQAVIYKILNGGKKEMIFTHEISVCEEMEDEEGDLRRAMKYTSFPTECPVPPGTYTFNDLMATVDSAPVNAANIGQYEFVVNYLTCQDEDCKEKTFECCFTIHSDIEAV